jgi:hypothetical protein
LVVANTTFSFFLNTSKSKHFSPITGSSLEFMNMVGHLIFSTVLIQDASL